MELLFKNARIITGNTAQEQLADVLIRQGKIDAVGTDLNAPATAEVMHKEGLCLSPGWMDVGVHTGDPGFEHREDLFSCAAAAAAGGFTEAACLPNTQPAVHSKSEVLYIKNKTAHLPVRFYPFGSVSVGCEGKDLAELYDMHTVGALAFSDGTRAVQDAGLMLRALEYVRAFDGLILNMPHHKNIAGGGQMHEGIISTQLGLRGIPVLAETLMIQRDLSLLEYAQSRLHIHLVSSAAGVALIRTARQAGLPVTASVAVANLCFTDAQLAGFDSHWKVCPPLRSETDRQALLEGLEDGTIDFICSNHTPWDTEAKNVEFPYAEFGMIGLETAFALCRTFLSDAIPLPLLIEKLAVAPRRVLGLPVPSLQPGAPANLTAFLPDAPWQFTEKDVCSGSKNTPFLGAELRGRVERIVHNVF